MQKINNCLWFDDQAEEAAHHYTSLFRDSRVLEVQRYTEAGPGTEGTVMTVRFQLAGQEFVALNGGPLFTFNEAMSLQVNCDSQDEVDEMWAKLSAGGEEVQCGWLKDKFGVSWQIVPTALIELVGDPDPVKSARVMEAMLTMKKIDIQALVDAHSG